VRVTRQLNTAGAAVPEFGPPKSRAGRRVVDFADLIVPTCASISALSLPVLSRSPRVGGELVAGVAQVVNVDAFQAHCGERWNPDPPPEVRV